MKVPRVVKIVALVGLLGAIYLFTSSKCVKCYTWYCHWPATNEAFGMRTSAGNHENEERCIQTSHDSQNEYKIKYKQTFYQ